MTSITQEQIIQEVGKDFVALYAEVVTMDCYHLRAVPFQPSVVFDIGANVGFFSYFARCLWSSAYIVSVEPDADNRSHFQRFFSDTNSVLVPKALGNGSCLYRGLTARNGSGATYLSQGLGFPQDQLLSAVDLGVMEPSEVPSLSLHEIVSRYCPDFFPERVVLKLDCEGAENYIWEDPRSMQVLQSMDYIAMELHGYGINTAERERVVRAESQALQSLERTHYVEREGVYVWALKRNQCTVI